MNSCHDVTGKVPRCAAVNCCAGAQVVSCHAGAAQIKKIIIIIIIIKKNRAKQASLSGEQDSLGRGERPPVWAQDYL